jgi:hypothetical protein
MWLWVLLGAGALGVVLGAGAFLIAARKPKPPADPEGVVEKPPVGQPPKAGPQTKPDPQNAPPQNPPEEVLPRSAPEIPGLRFYLSCDAIEKGYLTEGVSGKSVGPNRGMKSTDGPRGKAVRLTHDKRNSNASALDLSDHRDAFHIPANRPFTLMFWGRRFDNGLKSLPGAAIFGASTAQNSLHNRRLNINFAQSSASATATATFTMWEMSDRKDSGTVVQGRLATPVERPGEWNHYAILRDEKGELRAIINGVDAPNAYLPVCTGEMRYDSLYLLRSLDVETVFDIDDFCLYDRLLTGNEFLALTGLKLAPKPKIPFVEMKLPAPGEVPPATEISGLRFYLPFDKIEGGAFRESVSGMLVGKGSRLQLVDGPREKALRVTAGGNDEKRVGFGLTADASLPAIEAGKPFTMALWLRTDVWQPYTWALLSFRNRSGPRFRYLSLRNHLDGYVFNLQDSPVGVTSPKDIAVVKHACPPTKGWVHFAVTRDETGTVQCIVNGDAAGVAEVKNTSAFRFDEFAFGSPDSGTFSPEFDEFCLFERVLTGNELRKLAGRAR